MSGQQAIIDKIVSESEANAAKVIAQANEKAEAVLTAAREENNRAKTEIIERAKKNAEEIVQGRLSACDMEIRRQALGVRFAAVEEAFNLAQAEVLGLKDKEYLDYITRQIKAYAENGDTVLISKNDVKRITAEYIEGIAKEMGIKLTLSKQAQGFSGGVILRNANWDKNLTIDSDFRLLRERIEAEVVKMLEEKK